MGSPTGLTSEPFASAICRKLPAKKALVVDRTLNVMPVATANTKSTDSDSSPVAAVFNIHTTLSDTPSVISIRAYSPDPAALAVPVTRYQPALLVSDTSDPALLNAVALPKAMAFCKSERTPEPSAAGVRSIIGVITFVACNSDPKPFCEGNKSLITVAVRY